MLKPIIWICLFFSVFLYAHPHIFATVFLSVEFESSGEMIIKNRWVFDELYSVAKIDAVDINQDGKLSAEEWYEIERSVVQSAQRFNYYNYLLMGTQFMASNGYKNFEVKKEGASLVIYFDLNFKMKAQKEYTILTFALKDLSNYIQFDLDMNKVKVQAPSNIEVEFFTDVIEGLTLFKAFPPSTEALYLRFREK